MWRFESAILESRTYPVTRLTDSGIRQTNQCKGMESRLEDIGLHFDQHPVQTDGSSGIYGCRHKDDDVGSKYQLALRTRS